MRVKLHGRATGCSHIWSRDFRCLPYVYLASLHHGDHGDLVHARKVVHKSRVLHIILTEPSLNTNCGAM